MTDLTAGLAIALTALVTLLTRAAGPALVARIPITRRFERFLDGLSISVIAALVASGLARGGWREGAAVALAAVVVLGTRSSVLAMLAGMATAALWTYLSAG
ncbi:MAG: AzlD domain-containing protein [Rhodospirillaceae bacterium]|nr:AzlD domain-containing protein [Rhodospirillaceae bacterium]